VTPREREMLIEASVGAHRERDRDGRPVAPPEWWDLSPDMLEELHRRQLQARELERLIDPGGESSTAKAVMARILG